MTTLADFSLVEQILSALPSQIALVDASGVIVCVNRAWRDFAADNGLTVERSGEGQDYLAVCDATRGEDEPEARAVAAGIRAVLRSEIEAFTAEYPCHLPDAGRWFELRVTPYGGGGGGAVLTHTDITDRRATEIALQGSEAGVKRLNRVHAVLSGINSLLVRVRNRGDLFREACRIAVEAGGFKMALILLAAPDGVLAPAGSSGVDEAYLSAVVGALASPEATGTLAPLALSRREAIVSNDVSNDPTLLMGKAYADRGVRSLAALPLVVDGRGLGLLMLYSAETDFFHDAEMALLAELAGNVAFAVDHIQKTERIEYLAYFDDCTGLANRTLFLRRMADRLADAAGKGLNVCLMLFDLERFKSINDMFGRDAGDSLLRQVADWLRRHTGDETRVARIGADQFAAVTRPFPHKDDLMPHLDADLAAFLAHPFRLNEAAFRLSAKLGLAVFPADGDTPEGLLKHAEAALKTAKQTGARRLFYDGRMSEGLARRLILEHQMRQALDRGEFVLHYQPKVKLTTGAVIGAEALIRWNDPRGGLTPPGEFISVLEETGLIQEVGRWVLRTAVDDYLRWRAAGLAAVRVAVNVSPLQLRDHDFVAEVRRIVGADSRGVSGLELEVTERLIVEDITDGNASLQAIREGGVTVAIDDFGTGFSSLSYLAKLPVDTLKVDRSFITDMMTGTTGLSLVSTIITLGHSLGLNVVAEGVETEDQAGLLRALGCDEMQGFLIAEALPADEFASRFLQSTASGASA